MNYFWKGANSMLGIILKELKDGAPFPSLVVPRLRQALTVSLEGLSPDEDTIFITEGGKLSLGEEGGDGEREDKKYEQVLLGQRAASRWVLGKFTEQETWTSMHLEVFLLELEEEMHKTEVLARPPWFGALLSKPNTRKS